MTGALFSGTVRHRRFAPTTHAFRYRLFMAYVDVDTVEDLLDRLPLCSGSSRRWPPALVRFRREDYYGDPSRPLADAVRDAVEAACGRRPEGPVHLLTHLRQWGVSFNPVSFYYCFGRDGSVEAILAEVTNTPWDERHAYVLSEPSRRRGGVATYELEKAFHVSPFLPMQQRYRWRFSVPEDRLLVHMENFDDDGERRFDATLILRRRATITASSLLGAQLRHPAMPAVVLWRIYRQAAALWLKRVPFHDHPKHSSLAPAAELDPVEPPNDLRPSA